MRILFICRFASAVILVTAQLIANAGSFIATPGTSSTLGNSTIGHYMLSVTHNPAACSQVLAAKDHFRMGYLNAIGGSVEIGQVDNFENDINELVDLLEDSSITLDAADDLLDRFNGVLENLDSYGYVKANFDTTIPGLPMAVHLDSWKGSLCAEAMLAAQFKGSVLYAPLTLTTRNVNDSVEVDFSTDSALFVKSAQLTQLGLDYVRPVYQGDLGPFNGQLLAGTRVNFYAMQLSRQVILFENFEDEEVADVIKDEYDQNQQSNSNIGIDLGVSWIGKKYQLGFTLANINEPSFDYGDFSLNCNQLTATAQNNCLAAIAFVANGNISQQESYVMHALGTVDATYWLMSRWAIAASYDLADYNDPMGDELQWATVATAYSPMSRWFPAWRLGYRKNLVGESLASVNVGATLFGVFNMDLMYGLDTAVVDGDEVPRTAGLHFGFEQKY
jgi:hypothetical protein